MSLALLLYRSGASQVVVVGTGEIISPVDIGEIESPQDAGTVIAPIDLGETESPPDSGTISSPIDSGETVSPRDE